MITATEINNLVDPQNGWFHIEKNGDHAVNYGAGDAILRIDNEAVLNMVDEFNSRHFNEIGLLIDGDHLSHNMSMDTRALGWLKKLDTYKEPDSDQLELYGYIEWTPRGLEMLKNKEYVQSSTEYSDGMTFENGIYHPSKLTGFALTNRPRIKGKRALVNRDDFSEQMPEKETNRSDEQTPNPTMPDTTETKENVSAQSALLDACLNRLGIAFDGTAEQSEAILNRIDSLLASEKEITDKLTADVIATIERYENTLSESELSQFTDEQRDVMKNTLIENETMRTAFNNVLNRQSEPEQKEEQPEPIADVEIPHGEPLNRLVENAPKNPFEGKNTISSFANRVDELVSQGVDRYEACQQATKEGYVVLNNR